MPFRRNLELFVPCGGGRETAIPLIGSKQGACRTAAPTTVAAQATRSAVTPRDAPPERLRYAFSPTARPEARRSSASRWAALFVGTSSRREISNTLRRLIAMLSIFFIAATSS